MNSYVTLVTNDNYTLGAIALARSLQLCGSKWPLTVLTIADVTGLEQLETLGCNVIQVESLPVSDGFRQRHSRHTQHKLAPFTKGNKPTFHDPLHNFAKLRLWELEKFDKIIFLDADVIVIQNIDRLFQYPEFVAAPNLYESITDFNRLNSGVFVAEPNRSTFENMLAHLDRPEKFWPRTDQTFLGDFYPHWHGLPYIFNTLQYVWFNLPELWDWSQIHVIHYQYEKPWEYPHPKRSLLAPVIDVWHHVLDYGELPAHLPNPPQRDMPYVAS